MNRKNFLFIFSLVFSFFYIIKSAELDNKCQFEYFYINDEQTSVKKTNFELKNGIRIEEIKTFLSHCNYSISGYENKYKKINNTMTCRVLLINKDKDTNAENYDIVDIIKGNKVDLSSKKCNSVIFYFFSDDVMEKIKNCKVKYVNIFEQNIALNNPIEIKDYFLSPYSLGNSIYKTLKNKNLTNIINLNAKQYGENKTITLDELFKTSYRGDFYVKNGNEFYNFEKDVNENLCLYISSLKFKRNITVNFKIPENYILDVECPNSFTLDLYLNDFSVNGILESLITSLKKYFEDLEKKNPEYKPTCEIDFLRYGFNEPDEPIDPKKYTFKNTKNETLEITKNEDINETNIFNLTNNSTIEIEVGEKCELLKTMIAEVKFVPLEGTELNGQIDRKYHRMYLNLKDPNQENLKKQIINYFKSKKFEGLYIPEDYYEQIINQDGFKNGTHDHFELSIIFNENAKGSFIKDIGTPDPDLEYYKNHKEEEGEPIDPPQYNPPVQQEQIDTPKLDKDVGNCAKCCGKCVKCSNCKKEPAR